MTATETSTGPRLARLLPIEPSPRTASSSAPSEPSRPLPAPTAILTETRRTLDFDLETVAAGYADPNWVPNIVTAWACSWVDADDVECAVLPVARLHDRAYRASFLEPLMERIREAAVVTGHNIIRWDLPVLNAELMQLQMPVFGPLLAQDTMRVPRGRGFKKGQDNLASLLRVPLPKKALNWQEWQAAYAEPDLHTVRERVMGDVLQHKQLRVRMREQGWLEPPRVWKP